MNSILKIAVSAVLSAVALCGCGGGNGDWIDPGVNPGGGSDYVSLGGLKWMRKNLNIQTADSWCYGEGGKVDDNGDLKTLTSLQIQTNCNTYGRLYTWEAAKRACRSIGMRLPSDQEWDALIDRVGGYSVAGSKLKARNGWYDWDGNNSDNGTDDFGFSALPGGFLGPRGYFYGVGGYAVWWTATESDDGGAYGRHMYYDYDGVLEDGYLNDKSYGFSVRCVRDLSGVR